MTIRTGGLKAIRLHSSGGDVSLARDKKGLIFFNRKMFIDFPQVQKDGKFRLVPRQKLN